MIPRTALLLVLAAAVAPLTACSVSRSGAAAPGPDAAATSSAPASTGSAPVSTSAAPEPPATWGERFAWDDGLAVEIGAPVPCKPGEFAVPEHVERAVKIPIVIINESPESVDVFPMFTDQVQFDGRVAESIMDISGPCGSPVMPATVLSGKTFSTSMAVAVGPAPGELQVTVNPSIDHAQAVFVGPA